jgi:hypothetical protein
MGPSPLPVDLADVSGEAVGAELEAVGAERVGLDHLGAGRDVLLVDRPDEVGVGEVQLVEATVHEHAAGVEHRPHRPVEDHGSFGQALQERLHWRGCGSVAHLRSLPHAIRGHDAASPGLGRLRPLAHPSRPLAGACLERVWAHVLLLCRGEVVHGARGV